MSDEKRKLYFCHFGPKLCAALGLDGLKVKSITLTVAADRRVTAVVEQVVSEEECEEIIDLVAANADGIVIETTPAARP